MKTNTKSYKVEGMDCIACATLIEVELEDLGINAKCSYAKETLEIKDGNVDEKKIKSVISNLGYKISNQT